ncbi:MAG TPA: allophanate hydrolase subunit 1 [Jatrophihabitantaceae bacterium]|jgi:KipI family sensor histidine kinase inhibitor|nr:allophanate hydrolase subunit 1 [Jatrophihabitantaceae bacterium]
MTPREEPGALAPAATEPVRVLPYGDQALLIEPADPAQILPLRDALVGLPGCSEFVPAAGTLLVRIEAATFVRATLDAALTAALARAGQGAPYSDPDAPCVVLPVRYDGADLDLIADDAGCSPDEVVRRHSTATYQVAFCGFSPGFAYLSGGDRSLDQPRLATPRRSVPAGSVGIAAGYTGVYPRESPGGWRLLGTTAATLWDPFRDDPALLPPGTRVRFEIEPS